MARIGRIVLVVLLTLTLGWTTYVVHASNDLPLIDSNDLLDVVSPGPNRTVSKLVEVKFRIFDNNQAKVPVRLEIMDPRCVTKLRTIAQASYRSSKDFVVTGWNTTAAYKDGGVLQNGDYCFSICGDYKLGNRAYTSCNRRRVRVNNQANRAPRFTSIPPTSVAQGQNYEYRPTGDDPDGDRITFSVITKPDFLEFRDGVLRGNNIQVLGAHKIVLQVRDSKGASSRQEFTLTVAADQPTDPTPQPTFEVKFIYPQEGSTLTGEANTVQWSISGASLASVLQLDYRLAGSPDWTKLTGVSEDLAADTKFTWDVSKITPGNYQLRLVAALSAGGKQETVSPVFRIAASGGGEPTTEDIIIYDIRPENGAVITEVRPGVTAKINAGEKQTLALSEVKVSLQGMDISGQCQLNQSEQAGVYDLACPAVSDLTLGNYVGDIKVVDENGETLSERSWTFTIVAPAPSLDSEEVNIGGFKILRSNLGLLLLCCLCLPLLLLLLLSMLLSRRRRRSSTTTTNKTTTKSTYIDNSVQLGDAFSSAPVTPDNTYGEFRLGQNLDSQPAPISPAPSVVATTATVTNTGVPLAPAATSIATTTEIKEAKPNILQRLGGWFGKQRENVQTRIKTAQIKVAESRRKRPQPGSDKSEVESTTATQISAADVIDPFAAAPLAPAQPTTTSTTISDTASILAGDEGASLASNSVPVEVSPAPLTTSDAAPQLNPEPPQPQADLTTTTNSSTTTTVTGGNEDLPAWLRDDAAAAAPAAPVTDLASPVSGNADSSEDDDEGADPYGFGDQTLGS